MIEGTTWSTSTSSSSLEDEKEGEDEEDGGTGGGVFALWIGRVVGFFLFGVRGWAVKLENKRPTTTTCLNVPS